MTAAGYLWCLSAHARSVDAEARLAFATWLRGQLAGTGAVILETCHRAEAYLPAERLPADVGSALPAGTRLLRDEAAVRHALRVAAGLDSAVVSEDQVLHQLRGSVAFAREAGGLDPALERLFAIALRTGRRTRSWRTGPGASLGDLALDLIERRAGSLAGRRVLVVGAGTMGRATARAAVRRGALVAVASRSLDRAEALAAAVGARAVPFDPAAEAGSFEGVVVALRGPWALGQEAGDTLARAASVVVDLSVPGALPVEVGARLGPRFVSIDDLAVFGSADGSRQDDRVAARVLAAVEQGVDEFRAWLERREAAGTVRALADEAERERRAAVEALWRRLPGLDPGAREEIDAMSRHLARNLLRTPLARLAEDADGRREQAARDLFGL
jgi:glutamyl-tRNA reductase